MEVGYIGVKNTGGQVVFAHPFCISMAFGAEPGRFQPECHGSRIRLFMGLMAISACRHIRIVSLQQRFAVCAVSVLIINSGVTIAATCGHPMPRILRLADRMASMAVGANRSIPVSRCQSTRMIAVKLLFSLLFMARLALLAALQLKFAVVLGRTSGMRKLADAAVACGARLCAVN